jgi:hypothetical protein
MREIYNENNLGLADAFKVAIDKVVEEKAPEFYGRELVPFTDGSGYGISIGDKTVEWRKLKSIATAEIIEERDDDIPFAYSAGGTQIAKTHWIRSGLKMSVDDIDKLQSVNGDFEYKKLISQAKTVTETIKKTENDTLIYGYEPLNRVGLMNMPGKRTVVTGINMATATGAAILQMYIDIAMEFEKGGSEDFTARTLAIDYSLWAILQRPYNATMDSGVSILTRIQERNLFGRIKPVKNLINKTTGKPTQILEDDTEENFQAIDIKPLGAESWDLARTTYIAAEEKLSEILPFKPESVMEVQTA